VGSRILPWIHIEKKKSKIPWTHTPDGGFIPPQKWVPLLIQCNEVKGARYPDSSPIYSSLTLFIFRKKNSSTNHCTGISSQSNKLSHLKYDHENLAKVNQVFFSLWKFIRTTYYLTIYRNSCGRLWRVSPRLFVGNDKK